MSKLFVFASPAYPFYNENHRLVVENLYSEQQYNKVANPCQTQKINRLS